MKNGNLIIFMAGILLILNGYEIYSRFGSLFYPSPFNYSATAATARFYTSLDDAILIAGAFLMGLAIYRAIKRRYTLPVLNHFYPILAIYTVILAIAGGMIHIMPSGYHYPHYVSFFYGLPMFTPDFLAYYSHIIGVYIYPFQVISLIAAAIIGSAIFSYSLRGLKLKKATPMSIIGAVGVCPACATGTFFGIIIGASPFLSNVYLDQIYGSTLNELAISMVSIALMLGVFIYMIRNYRIVFQRQ
ncbi:hypothetical protein [Ferroplasma sp.]|uniref:hypothetical protein n=1 Tax=Ferroplasma sp. TaxID=2591003 RepID=UPI0026146F37|nr:hypothetical protein [Ferroplasma sp.]MCL4453046.1 hypothetical protein [Candidatus Thermoplasmatota archaeon]